MPGYYNPTSRKPRPMPPLELLPTGEFIIINGKKRRLLKLGRKTSAPKSNKIN